MPKKATPIAVACHGKEWTKRTTTTTPIAPTKVQKTYDKQAATRIRVSQDDSSSSISSCHLDMLHLEVVSGGTPSADILKGR